MSEPHAIQTRKQTSSRRIWLVASSFDQELLISTSSMLPTLLKAFWSPNIWFWCVSSKTKAWQLQARPNNYATSLTSGAQVHTRHMDSLWSSLFHFGWLLAWETLISIHKPLPPWETLANRTNRSDNLQPTSDGLQPKSVLATSSDALVTNSNGLQRVLFWTLGFQRSSPVSAWPRTTRCSLASGSGLSSESKHNSAVSSLSFLCNFLHPFLQKRRLEKQAVLHVNSLPGLDLESAHPSGRDFPMRTPAF